MIHYDTDSQDASIADVPNIAKLTSRVYLWPGWGDIQWEKIEDFADSLNGHGVEWYLTIRTMEWANIHVSPLTCWTNSDGETCNVVDWNSEFARAEVVSQVGRALGLGAKGVCLDTRSHVNDKDVEGYSPSVGESIYLSRANRVAEGVERLAADLHGLAVCEIVAPVIAQGFDWKNLSKYKLDGAQHIANTAGVNYAQRTSDGLFLVRPQAGYLTISGGLAWTAEPDVVDRWLAHCRANVPTNCDTIKYEAHALLKDGKKGRDTIRDNIKRCEQNGFGNVILYDTATFARDKDWVRETPREN